MFFVSLQEMHDWWSDPATWVTGIKENPSILQWNHLRAIGNYSSEEWGQKAHTERERQI